MTSVTYTLISEEKRAHYLKYKPMDEVLPLTVKNEADVTEYQSFKLVCSRCGKDDYEDIFMLKTINLPGGGIQLETFKICYECNLMTEYLFRLYPDGRIVQLLGNGKFTEGYVTNSGLFSKLADLIKPLANLLKRP